MLGIHLVKGCQLIPGSKSFHEKWGICMLWINRPSIAPSMRCRVSWNWSAAKCSLDFQHSWKWISFSLFLLPWAPDICSFLCSGWRKRQRARKAIEPVAINGYFGTGWRYKGGPRWGQEQERLLLQEGKGVHKAWQSLCDQMVLRSSAPSQELTAQLQPFVPSFLLLGSVPSPQMPAECRSLESLSDCMNQTSPDLVLVLPEEIPECEAQQGSLTHALTWSSYPMERDALDSGKDSRCTCLVLSKSEIWKEKRKEKGILKAALYMFSSARYMSFFYQMVPQSYHTHCFLSKDVCPFDSVLTLGNCLN